MKINMSLQQLCPGFYAG